MTPDYYHVSDEWAKQIALEAFGEIDFATVKVIKVPINYRDFTIALPPELQLQCQASYVSPLYPIFKTDTIQLLIMYDDYNEEYTHIGYSEPANTIVLGETRKA